MRKWLEFYFKLRIDPFKSYVRRHASIQTVPQITAAKSDSTNRFFFFFPSSHTVWCRGKYKVRVRGLDVAAPMSQFSSDEQMCFISSAQSRLGRPRIDYVPKTIGVEI